MRQTQRETENEGELKRKNPPRAFKGNCGYNWQEEAGRGWKIFFLKKGKRKKKTTFR